MVRPPGGTEDPEDGGSINWGDIIGTPSIPSSLSDIAPDLAQYKDRIIAIAKNPRSFVLGAIFAAIFGFVLDIFYVFYNGMRIAFIGEGVGYTEGEAAGIEDLFYIGWDIISGAGEAVGEPIINLIDSFQVFTLDLATSAGIASFPLTVLVLFVVMGVTYVTLKRLGWATIAAIPIVGPMMEALFK